MLTQGILGPGIPSAAGHVMTVLTSDNKSWRVSDYTVADAAGNDGKFLVSDGTNWTAIVSAGGVPASRLAFNHTMTGSTLVGLAPANSLVSMVVIKITQAFDPAVTIEVGDTGNHARLVSSADNAPDYIGYVYQVATNEHFSVDTSLYVTITGASATGIGEVIIYYAVI
jgi:hypothetical protein